MRISFTVHGARMRALAQSEPAPAPALRREREPGIGPTYRGLFFVGNQSSPSFPETRTAEGRVGNLRQKN